MRLGVTVLLLAVLTACASEKATKKAEPAQVSPSATASPTMSTTGAPPSASPSPTGAATGLANACPTDGCRVKIASVTPADGGELRLDFEANFAPDFAHNHFHVYWDRYSAQQVSDDAQPRFGVTQGVWVPTADDPYTTGEDVSVTKREGSPRICVTAGNGDHDVIDPALYDCVDAPA